MPSRLATDSTGFRTLIGVGGVGTGIFFALEGDHTLGRNESRPGRLLDVRDYCKLHIIAHYVSVLLGAKPSGKPFHVLPFALVGADAVSERLLREMAQAGMDTRFVRTLPDAPTLQSVCFQYPDGSGGNITTSNSAASALTAADVEEAKEVFEESRGRLVALSAPEAPLEARLRLLELATEFSALRAAAFTTAEIPTARDMGFLDLVDLVSLNEDEGQAVCGETFDTERPEAFLNALAQALSAGGREVKVILTAGRSGAYAFDDGRWFHCPTVDIEVASTAGAGDALLGAIIAGLCAGLPLSSSAPTRKSLAERPIETALELAVLLAAYTVTSPHTIHPKVDLDSLKAFAGTLGIAFAESVEAKFVN